MRIIHYILTLDDKVVDRNSIAFPEECTNIVADKICETEDVINNFIYDKCLQDGVSYKCYYIEEYEDPKKFLQLQSIKTPKHVELSHKPIVAKPSTTFMTNVVNKCVHVMLDFIDKSNKLNIILYNIIGHNNVVDQIMHLVKDIRNKMNISIETEITCSWVIKGNKQCIRHFNTEVASHIKIEQTTRVECNCGITFFTDFPLESYPPCCMCENCGTYHDEA